MPRATRWAGFYLVARRICKAKILRRFTWDYHKFLLNAYATYGILHS